MPLILRTSRHIPTFPALKNWNCRMPQIDAHAFTRSAGSAAPSSNNSPWAVLPSMFLDMYLATYATGFSCSQSKSLTSNPCLSLSFISCSLSKSSDHKKCWLAISSIRSKSSGAAKNRICQCGHPSLCGSATLSPEQANPSRLSAALMRCHLALSHAWASMGDAPLYLLLSCPLV